MTGRAFARYLYEQAGVTTEDDNLALASQLYETKFGAAKLAELCRDVFTIRTPSNHHTALLNLPWQRIYTTNYDDLLEKSGSEVGKALASVTLDDAPEKFLSNARVCLHINGLINRLSALDLVGGFKLTASSYLNDAFTTSTWSSVFRQDFRLARAIIFVGYSMYDLDIQRIVHSEDTKDKTFFITSPPKGGGTTPDDVFLPIFGEVCSIGIENFATQIAEIVKKYRPQTKIETFVALEKVEAVPVGRIPTNSDIEKLFLYGTLEKLLIPSNSLVDPDRYYVVDRISKLKIEERLRDEQDIVITSNLGNGKTVALEQISAALAAQGWNVFKVSSDTKDARKEGLRALSLAGNTVVLIDNYIPLLDFIDFLSIRRTGRNFRFLLTVRTHVHEAFLDRLEQALRTQSVASFDLNRLTKSESQEIVKLIDNFGLWADFSGWSDVQKLRLITSECDSQLHQVLLKLYQSPHIAAKVTELFSSIRPNVRRIAIAAFVIRGSGLSSDRRLLNDLLRGSPLVRLSNADRESVKFLWDDSSGHIRLKSSVLAEYYLTSLGDAAEVVDVLIEMYFRAYEMRPVGKEYDFFIRSVMSFSALQKMLPRSGLRGATIRFYEAIQTSPFTRKNPHYWLQYAIARLSFEDNLTEIAPYFQSAYAFAKLSNYDTYQIDNHFARFLLVQAARESNVDISYEKYKEAKGILLKQTLHEQKYYPYRVASGVLDFVKTHVASLDPHRRRDVIQFCGEVQKRIGRLPMEMRTNRHVMGCSSDMRTALAELQEHAGDSGGKPRE
ncbi:hypothetical protein SRS16CHR_03573 [Variovorax sp. SRS16]|nr:hypothetical protein SRS16CHR_03573 [Variovorax sp. SRS16]